MKLKAMYKDASAPVKASFWFMFANITQKAVSVITTMIFARLLTKNDYGVLSNFQAWYGVLSVIITMCLPFGVYSNAMIDYKDELDEFTSSMLSLVTINTAFAFVLYLVFSGPVVDFLKLPSNMIYLLFLSIWLNPALDFWLAQQKFNYKYRKSIFVSLFTAIGGAVLAYLFVVFLPFNKAFGKTLGGSILTFAVSLYIYFSMRRRGRVGINKEYWKYALTFSIPLIPHFLSNVVLSSSDKIIITNMIGNEAAGLYGVAYSAATIIQIVSSAVNASWIPWTYRKLDKKEFSDIGNLAKPIILVFAVACFAFITFAPEIIFIIVSNKYREAIWCMPPIILGIFFIFIYSLFSNIEFFYKKTKLIMIATSAAAILNVVLNMIFIPIFGYIAAAYTTLVGYIALSIAHYFFMKKAQKAKIYDVKFVIIVSAVLMAASFVIMLFYEHFIIRYVIIFIIAIIVFIKRDYIISVMKKLKAK